MLEISGFDVLLSQQTIEVLARMKWMFLLTPVLIWMLSLLLVCLYPLNRSKLVDIRHELEQRRGKL